MSCDIHTEPCDLIDRGYVDERAKYLLTLWRQTKGEIEDPNLFEGIAPYLVRFAGHVPETDSPEIQFVGRASLLGRSVKLARRTKSDRRKLFKTEHRKTLRAGFELALREPTLQLVQDDFATDDGLCKMTYEKLSLRWNANGIPFLFSYSKLLNISPLERLSHPAAVHDRLQLRPDQGLWRQAGLPTEGHFHTSL